MNPPTETKEALTQENRKPFQASFLNTLAQKRSSRELIAAVPEGVAKNGEQEPSIQPFDEGPLNSSDPQPKQSGVRRSHSGTSLDKKQSLCLVSTKSEENKRDSSFDSAKKREAISGDCRLQRRELDLSSFSDMSSKKKDDSEIVRTSYKKRSLLRPKQLFISQTFDALVDQAKGLNLTSMTENYPSYKIDKRLIFLGKEVKYPKHIIPYQSSFRKTWNLFIVALIIYQLCWHTFGCTFIFGEKWPTGCIVVEVLSIVIFLLDIWINFRTTYSNKNNEEIIDAKMIRISYMKSKLFIIDVVTVLPIPELIVLVSGKWNVYSVIVLIRMLRAFKIPKYLENRTFSFASKLFLMVIATLVMEHWATCLWYAIVKLQMNDDDPIDHLYFPPNIRQTAVGEEDLLFYYNGMPKGKVYSTTLLGIFMLSVGSDMGPVTNLQTGYCFMVALFGAVGLAFMYARVTQIISANDNETIVYQEKLEELKEKLHVNKIPYNLKVKVMEYFHYSWKKRVVLKKMNEFNEVSLPLQRDIKVSQHHHIVFQVPLFKELDPIELLSIIQTLKIAIYMPGDKIVREGEKATEMFFIQEGTVEILKKRPVIPPQLVPTKPQLDKTFLNKGRYFGELALLSNLKTSYNANAFEFCILYTYSRNDFEKLKREFSDIGPRLRTGFRHYKNERINSFLPAIKNLDIFQGFTDPELLWLLFEYFDEVFIDPSQVILNPKKKEINALYVVFDGTVNCYSDNEATRNYVKNLQRSDAQKNWTVVDVDEREEIDCLDDEILNLEKDKLSMDDDKNRLDLIKVYAHGDSFGTLDFGVNEVRNKHYFITDGGCQMLILPDQQKEKMIEEDPTSYNLLKANFAKLFPKKILGAIDEESDSSMTSKNNTILKNGLSRKTSLVSDHGKQPALMKKQSFGQKEELFGVKGELQRLGEEMNMFNDLVKDIHLKLDKIMPNLPHGGTKSADVSPDKVGKKVVSLLQILEKENFF